VAQDHDLVQSPDLTVVLKKQYVQENKILVQGLVNAERYLQKTRYLEMFEVSGEGVDGIESSYLGEKSIVWVFHDDVEC